MVNKLNTCINFLDLNNKTINFYFLNLWSKLLSYYHINLLYPYKFI